MNLLLRPGVRALARFRFAHKFQLIALMFVLPIAYAAWAIGSDYAANLSRLSAERSGVYQLRALDRIDEAILRARNLAARWKTLDTTTQSGAPAQAALADVSAHEKTLRAAVDDAARVLEAEGASAEALADIRDISKAVDGLQSDALKTLNWWPDAYQRFTDTLQRVSSLRDRVGTDTGLILDPMLDTYLLQQFASQTSPQLGRQLGTLASVGQGVVASGSFSLQTRLQLREIRSSLDASRDGLVKAAGVLERIPEPSLDSWKGQYRQTLAALDGWLGQLDQNLFGDKVALDMRSFEVGMDSALGAAQSLQTATLETLERRLGEYHAQALSAMVITLTAFGVLALLAMYAFLCLQASIRASASEITAMAQALRRGDLRQQTHVVGRDELATIGAALNEAVVQLRGSLTEVNQEAAALDDTVSSLTSHAQSSLVSVERQQQQVSQIAAAATQMAATAQSVAESCEQAARDVGETRQIATLSNQRSQATTEGMRGLINRLSASSGAMTQLDEQAQRIGRVVDVIGGIAEQTNLLALNAAIEAARAGDHGRGFAVVADEVRGLSRRTQESTREIGTTVQALQSVVAEAVRLMQEAYAQAEEDVSAVDELGQRLGDIVGAVQRVEDMIAQIAIAVEEQAATAEDVSGNIQQVDQAALHLLEGAQSVHGVADRLNAGSRSLSQSTATFQL